MTDSKTATERLRELLDARGVEWSDSSDENLRHTTWNDMNCWFNEFPDGWTAWGMAMRGTPEQAIAATLGSDDVRAADYWHRMFDEHMRECTTLGFDRDEVYDAGFTNGVKATLQQLDGLLMQTDSAVEIQAWVDRQWEEEVV